jgi:AcrR family transcriptional regulator
MLQAAEQLLDRDGGKGLTLRAAARAAGVSHAAPTHHFGDLTGLLSELAATGFLRFSDHLRRAAAEAGDDPRARMIALGKAYVRFAQQYPGMFLLMFRGERLDRSRPGRRRPMRRSRSCAGRSGRGPRIAQATPGPGRSARGRWCMASQCC